MYKKLSVIIFISMAFMAGIVSPVLADAGQPLIRGWFGVMSIPVTYIYGYNNSVVIAKVTNGIQTQVAFSSFESADKGFWDYSGSTGGSAADLGRTGTKYYNLGTGAISRSGMPSGKYILSYWSKGGGATLSGSNFSLISETSDMTVNSWVYHECICEFSTTSSIQLTGNIQIDELRLYPFMARMTTFTYIPLVGKTSETDLNNITTFYEYDEFFRLKCVKDHNGNILKNNIYHLKGQQ
jgi:hypothetical protein